MTGNVIRAIHTWVKYLIFQQAKKEVTATLNIPRAKGAMQQHPPATSREVAAAAAEAEHPTGSEEGSSHTAKEPQPACMWPGNHLQRATCRAAHADAAFPATPGRRQPPSMGRRVGRRKGGGRHANGPRQEAEQGRGRRERRSRCGVGGSVQDHNNKA